MSKKKRKLTAEEKAKKQRCKKECMTIFVNGKQKQVKRPQTIDGISVDEFIRNNEDPIWLHQNEMWDYMIEMEGLFVDPEADEEKRQLKIQICREDQDRSNR